MEKLIFLILIIAGSSITYASDIGFFYVLSDTPELKADFDKDAKAKEIGAGKAHRLSIDGKKVIHKNVDYTFDELVQLRKKGKKILNMKEARELMLTEEWTGAKVEVVK